MIWRFVYLSCVAHVAINFVVQVIRVAPHQSVWVVGSIPRLGNWDRSRALKLYDGAYPTWRTSLAFPRGTLKQFEYVSCFLFFLISFSYLFFLSLLSLSHIDTHTLSLSFSFCVYLLFLFSLVNIFPLFIWTDTSTSSLPTLAAGRVTWFGKKVKIVSL